MTQESQLARLGLFDAKVPRYTSYPTAPHFAGGVDAGLFGQWIEEIPEGAQISLYLHVPFCRRLCWFCACRTQGTSSEDPVIRYAQSLHAELALLKRRLPKGVTLSRLHWGGGTPTMLPADDMRRLADAIFAVVPMAEGAEFSVEIDPNDVDGARLDALAAAGMNRASIGVQDFDPLIQAAIGREQSFELTARVVDMIRARGIDSLNADILYGLPHQTEARIRDSVEKLIALSPERVALYGYAHVPWMSRRQQLIPADAMPSAQERLSLFDTATKLFKAAGYLDIGIDHFAKPSDSMAKAQVSGELRRNFQGYTVDPSPVLIGLGASSISRFPQGYAQNAPATSDYVKAVREGQFATHRGHAFSGDDRLRGRIIEALMCDFHVSRADILRHFDILPAALDQLLRQVTSQFEDMLILDASGLTIPAAARPLTRIIARGFDAYDQSRAKHSAAI